MGKGAWIAISLILFAMGPETSLQEPMERIAILEDLRSLGDDGELLGYLTHGNPEVRSRTCLALGRIQAPAAIAPLRGRLNDADPGVKEVAAFALGQVALLHPDPFRLTEGPGAESVDALASLAGKGAVSLRARAVEALGKIGGEKAAATLRGLTTAAEVQVRREAALGLARSRAPDAVPALEGLLEDPSVEVRAAAAYALGQVDGPLPLEALSKAAADEDPAVRFSCYQGVRRRKEPGGLPLYEKGIGEKDPRCLVEVMWGLAASGSPSRIRDLSKHRESPHFPVRAALARCLAGWEGKEVTKILRELEADPSPTVRWEVTTSWGQREDGMDAVLRAASDDHSYVREAACKSLALVIHRSRSEAIRIFVSPTLTSPYEVAHRLDFAGLLASSSLWRGRPAEPFGGSVIGRRLLDPSPAVRASAARAAGPLAGGPARPQLLGLVEDTDPWVRAEAALTLALAPGGFTGDIEDPPAGAAAVLDALTSGESAAILEAIEKGLADPEASVRAFAARALEGAGPAGADLCRTAAGDEDTGVVQAALRSLVRSARDEEGVAETLTAAAGHEDAGTRLLLTFLLAEMDGEIVSTLLERLAADPSEKVRRMAALHLAWTTGTTPASGDRTDKAIARSVALLARTGRAWKTLGRLAEDENVTVQAAALEGIGLVPNRSALRRHVAAVGSSDPGVTYQAAKTLGSHPIGEAIGPLRKAYGTWQQPGTPDVRLEIVRALAATGDDRCKPTLEEARSDPDPVIREEARLIFRKRSWTEPETRPIPPPELARALRDGKPIPDRPRVIIEFEKGKLSIDLFPDAAPIHVRNFLRLVEAGLYDGLAIHRVVPNFVIQGGDPLGTGWGCAGEVLRDEVNTVKYTPGTVGMPKAGKDTGGCQFFITHVTTPWLDGRYTAFGRVSAGMDLLDEIDVDDRIVRMQVAK